MALNLVANLTLKTRGFVQGLATSQTAAAKFSRFLGSQVAAGAAAQAGGFATQSLLQRLFGGAKSVASEIPGARAISGAADAIQPIVDPLGLKRKMLLALGAGSAAAAFVAQRGVSAISEVKDLSEQMDQTTTTVQKLGTVAKASGLDVSQFQNALSAGNNARQQAAESNEQLRNRFRDLGVSLRDLQDPGKKTLDLMKQIVATAGDVHSESFRAAFRDIFGRGSERLIAPLSALVGGAGGPVISERSVTAVDRMSKAFERLGDRIRSAFGEVTGRVVDAFFRKLDDKSSLIGALAKAGSVVVGIAERKIFGPRAPMPGDEDFIGPLPAPGASPYVDELALREQEKVSDLREQIHDANLRGMPPDEQRLELSRDRLKIEREIAELQEVAELGGKVKESEFLELELKRAQIEADLAQLSKLPRAGGGESVVDSLAKIGGFTPGVQNDTVRIVLDEINRNTRETAQNTRPEAGDGW